jgi:chaperonin GroEL
MLSFRDPNISIKNRLLAYKEEYEDLVKAGVIDPVKVVRCALENAASVASLMLTTETMIADKPKKDSGAAAPAHGGMGGMGGYDM